MFRSFRAPSAIASLGMSLGALMVVALVGGSVVFLSGVLEVKAAPQTTATVHQTKSDRLVIAKGTACSALGWPHYERGCQFDMRLPANDMRTVRVIALR